MPRGSFINVQTKVELSHFTAVMLVDSFRTTALVVQVGNFILEFSVAASGRNPKQHGGVVRLWESLAGIKPSVSRTCWQSWL